MKRPTRANEDKVFTRACKSVTFTEAQWTFRRDDLVALADDAAEQSWFNFMMAYPKDFAPRLFNVRFIGFPRNAPT